MLLFDMSEEASVDRLRRALEKLAWLSRLLGEVDEWLEGSARGPNGVRRAEGIAVTPENLDAHISREEWRG